MEQRMTSQYEPPGLEIFLTLSLGLTILTPYYKNFTKDLNLNGNEKVLDFGSGSGICTRFIAQAIIPDGELVCVDISSRWMRVIRNILPKKGNIQFYCGHLDQSDLPERYYDLVIMHFVLHDIPAHEQPVIMHLLSKKLTQGGKMILREPMDHGLTRDDVEAMGTNAGLILEKYQQRSIKLIGKVMDFSFIREN